MKAIAALTSAALVLSACSNKDDSATNNDGQASAKSSAGAEQSNEAFPVTIKHAFGETTIEKKPERVATVAWSNHEVPLALGVVPVGFEKATWGDDDDNGIMPWVEEKLKELGGDQPVLFDATDSIPYEEVANTKPDVILASYSGLTKEQYDQLSKIAPVVAYPTTAWGTTWQEMIEMNSKAMGMEEQGKKLIDDLQKQREEAFNAYPDLKGKKVLFGNMDASDLSKISFYNPSDSRMSFLLESGFEEPSGVKQHAEEGKFNTEVSAEKADDFADTDVIVTYGSDDAKENEELLKALQKDPQLSKIKAIKEGHVVFLGNTPEAAVSNPSPLDIPWGLKDYFGKINDALSS